MASEEHSQGDGTGPLGQGQQGPSPETPIPRGQPVPSPKPEPTAAPGLSAWKRLHPISPLVNLLPHTWRLLKGYWPFLLAIIIGTNVSPTWTDVSMLLAFFAIAGIRSFIHWATLRYRIRDERLEIGTGLVHRRTRLIGPERIQNAELVRNPIHRLTGLVELRVETAGEAGAEGLLSALALPEAQVLMQELERLRRAASGSAGGSPDSAAEDAPPENIIVESGLAEIVAHGLSGRRTGMFALLVVVFLELSQQLSPDGVPQLSTGLEPRFLLGLLLGALVLGWLLSTATSILKHHGFRLKRQGDRFVTRQGLLTRRQVVLPGHRIQLLRVDEPLLRRLMGYCSIQVETAGLSMGPDELKQAETCIPMLDRDQAQEICTSLLPSLDKDPWLERLEPAPLRALILAQGVAIRNTLLLSALACWFTGAWGLLALLAGPPLGLAAFLEWRWQAWFITENTIIARRGFWQRRTWLLPRQKVQSLHGYQGPLLRIHGLGRVLVKMAGSRVMLPPIRWKDSRSIIERSVYKGRR